MIFYKIFEFCEKFMIILCVRTRTAPQKEMIENPHTTFSVIILHHIASRFPLL